MKLNLQLDAAGELRKYLMKIYLRSDQKKTRNRKFETESAVGCRQRSDMMSVRREQMRVVGSQPCHNWISLGTHGFSPAIHCKNFILIEC